MKKELTLKQLNKYFKDAKKFQYDRRDIWITTEVFYGSPVFPWHVRVWRRFIRFFRD